MLIINTYPLLTKEFRNIRDSTLIFGSAQRNRHSRAEKSNTFKDTECIGNSYNVLS